MVNKTAVFFNNIVFILVAKITSKKVCEKMENNSMLKKFLLVCIRNAELFRLVRATFDSKVAFLRRKDEEEKFNNSEKLAEICLPFFVLFVCRC